MGKHLPSGVVLEDGRNDQDESKEDLDSRDSESIEKIRCIIEWLMERIAVRDEEMENVELNEEMDDREKNRMLKNEDEKHRRRAR